MLWDSLHRDHGCQYLFTNRLKQDCLENLFGVIRQSGLCRDNLTPEQCGSVIRHASINILMKSNSNCITCSDDLIATLKTLTLCKRLVTSTMSDATFLNQSCSSIPSTTASSCTQSLPALAITDVLATLPKKNTLYYIVGYLLHKLQSTGHRCDDITSCNIDRVEDLQRDVTSPQQILTYNKTLHKSLRNLEDSSYLVLYS